MAVWKVACMCQAIRRNWLGDSIVRKEVILKWIWRFWLGCTGSRKIPYSTFYWFKIIWVSLKVYTLFISLQQLTVQARLCVIELIVLSNNSCSISKTTSFSGHNTKKRNVKAITITKAWQIRHKPVEEIIIKCTMCELWTFTIANVF
jgi:hypothetical protein